RNHRCRCRRRERRLQRDWYTRARFATHAGQAPADLVQPARVIDLHSVEPFDEKASAFTENAWLARVCGIGDAAHPSPCRDARAWPWAVACRRDSRRT